MRIAILTLPLHTNYGGILQAYALQTILERMGHEVVVLSRNFNIVKYPPIWKYPLYIIKRCFKKIILQQNIEIFSEYHHNKTYRIISQYTQEFINKYIHTHIIDKFDELNEKDFDCIVVGSDQVWRKKYFIYHYATAIEKAYLSFAKDWNVKKIAYAVSFGSDVWEYNDRDTNKCKEFIKQFQAVSVREKSGMLFCKEKFDVDAIQLLDPTLLLQKEDYLKLLNNNIKPSPGNLMVYILDENEETEKILAEVIKKTKLCPFKVIAKKASETTKNEEIIQPPLESWLRGFYDAKFIVTDSFHACVFSMIFNKPFMVIGNKSRGIARFWSLLDAFNLEDRLVSSLEEARNKINFKEPNVLDKINDMRTPSLSYLKRCLEEEITK